jgi:hypothetical protein
MYYLAFSEKNSRTYSVKHSILSEKAKTLVMKKLNNKIPKLMEQLAGPI